MVSHTYSVSHKSNTNVVTDLEVRLPRQLTIDHWRRFRYTMEDIRAALNSLPRRTQHRLALIYDVPCNSNSVTTASYFADTAVIYKPRASIVDQIMRKLPREFERNHMRVLDKKKCTVLPVPLVSVSSAEYQRNLLHMPESWDPSVPTTFHTVWNYEDIRMVPVYMDDKRICMHRIVPWYERHVYCPANEMAVAIVQGEQYYITDESCMIRAL